MQTQLTCCAHAFGPNQRRERSRHARTLTRSHDKGTCRFRARLMQSLRTALKRGDRSILEKLGKPGLADNRKAFTAVRDITALGGDAFLIVGGLLIAALQYRGAGIGSALMVAGFLGVARGAGWTLKAIFRRQRPPDPVKGAETFTSSFPSIHTINAFCVFFALGFVATGGVSSAALVAGGVMAALVGSTRLILRVHWPSDVLAGFLCGLAFSLVGAGFL